MEEKPVGNELPDFIQALALSEQVAPNKQHPWATPEELPVFNTSGATVPTELVAAKRTSMIAFWATIWPLTIIPDLILVGVGMYVPGGWGLVWSIIQIQLVLWVLAPILGPIMSIIIIVGRRRAKKQGLLWPEMDDSLGIGIVLGFVPIGLVAIGFLIYLSLFAPHF